MSRKVTPLNVLKWRTEHLIYVVLEFLLSSLSLSTVYKLGAFLGMVVYKLSPKYRGIVKRNLMMTLGKDSIVMPSDSLIEEVFEKNGGNLLTTLAAGKKRIRDIEDHLEIEGLEGLEKAANTSGVILILSHMGNWEILTKLTDQVEGSPELGALYRPLNNPYMNKLILGRRQGSGMRLISSKKPAFNILKLLKNKGVMCILSDQKIGAKGAVASFFGRPTSCTRLPLMMKEKSNAALFTLSMVSLTPSKWKITVKPIIDSSQQGVMDALSQSMNESLADCFWFQDRWQDFPHPRILSREKDVESIHYEGKQLPGIVESRAVLSEFPDVFSQLSSEFYPIEIWDEGASPEEAFFAIGKGEDFKKACKRVGLKKGVLTPEAARNVLKRSV